MEFLFENGDGIEDFSWVFKSKKYFYFNLSYSL